MLALCLLPRESSQSDRRGIEFIPDITRGNTVIIDPELRDALSTAFAGSAITNINVEVDYMATGGHSHILNPTEVAMIEGMFACQGITITIDVDDEIPETGLLVSGGSGLFDNTDPGQYLDIKNTYFDHDGQPGWHYCIMGHQYNTGSGSGSSGLAEIFGDDFIVTLGSFANGIGTPFDRAGTFVHELGHNLGLTHAGDQNEGTVTQYKPNYPSLMAYRYQLAGVRHELLCEETTDSCIPHKNLDYSHGLMPDLDENALDERLGVGFGSTDWNCNGVIDTFPVVYDLAGFPCFGGGSFTVNRDYDDWSNIVDVTFTLSRSALVNREVITCISIEEIESAGSSAAVDCDNDPGVAVEPCEYPYSDWDGDGVGNECDNCAPVYNPYQRDLNDDGTGDVCLHCEIGADVTVGQAPLTVNFSGSSDLTVNTWTWTFGNGGNAGTQNAQETFATPGLYDVSLTVDALEGDYTATIGQYIAALADTLDFPNVGTADGVTVQYDVYATNTIPVKALTIALNWTGPLNLSLAGESKTGLRSDNMPFLQLVATNPFTQEALYKLNASPDPSTYLQPGAGPILSLFFDVPSGVIGSNDIIFTTFSGETSEFSTDPLDYSPYLSNGVISIACGVGSGGDVDGDGVCGIVDICPDDYNPGQEDSDFDSFGDACDNCPAVFQLNQNDSDGDGAGDACDICPGADDFLDTDGDTVPDCLDACPTIPNPCPSCCDTPGDANNDSGVNIADVTFLIARIFAGGAAPACCEEGDANGSGNINIADVTYMIARIFSGGPAPICGPMGMSCFGQ